MIKEQTNGLLFDHTLTRFRGIMKGQNKGVIMSQVSLNQPAPDFSLTRFTGEPFTLSDLRGHRHILLVFNRTFT
jgi:hypothetical protein